LEDHAANLYVWVVKENYSGEANEIADGIVSAYTKRRGRTPAATHLVTSTPVDVLAMTKEQLLHVLHSTGESVNPST
jgi:Tfp pilus assembly protein PilW